MNATTDNRSAADLERQGEQIREDLDRTLDEIQRKFSPGELMDRSVEFIRETGSELLREAGETVRRNPVPVLLTAAGLIWLTASVVRSRSGSGYSDEGEELSRYRARSDEDYSGTGEMAEEEDWDSSTHGRVSNAAHKVKSKARQVKGRVTSRLSGSMQSMQDRTSQARSNFERLVQEQPLALGALALAAGALLGAALPVTQYERRYVGPVHDRAMARAKEVGQRQYDNLKQAVSSSVERATSQSRAPGSDAGSQRQTLQGQTPGRTPGQMEG